MRRDVSVHTPLSIVVLLKQKNIRINAYRKSVNAANAAARVTVKRKELKHKFGKKKLPVSVSLSIEERYALIWSRRPTVNAFNCLFFLH